METHVVYHLCYLTNLLSVKSQYTIENVARNGIEKNALNYIKDQYGEVHMNKSLLEEDDMSKIADDPTIKCGTYLVKELSGRVIVVKKFKKEITKTKKQNQEITYSKVKPSFIEKIFTTNETKKIITKKVVKEPIVSNSFSYLSSFIINPEYKEVEVEEEIEITEPVSSTIKLYVENVVEKKKLVTIDVQYVEKIITCEKIGEFNMMTITVEHLVPNSNNSSVSNNVMPATEQENKNKKAIKEVHFAFVNELISRQKNGACIVPSDFKKRSN